MSNLYPFKGTKIMKFRPKYKHDCRACIFLGRYKFMAGFVNGERKVTVDLFCCTGIDASVIARYGNGNRYASCPVDMLATLEHATGTFSDGLREATRRAIALGLIPPPSPAKTNWTNGETIRIVVDVQGHDHPPRAHHARTGKSPRCHIGGWEGGEWEEFVEDGRMSARVSFAPWVHTKRPVVSPQPKAGSTITSPPPDPLAFLRSLAADAIESAERLEVWAAKTHDTQTRANHNEAAQKWRARAEAHQIAIVKMERAITKPNGAKS